MFLHVLLLAAMECPIMHLQGMTILELTSVTVLMDISLQDDEFTRAREDRIGRGNEFVDCLRICVDIVETVVLGHV